MKFIIFVLSLVGIVLGAPRGAIQPEWDGSNWLTGLLSSNPMISTLGHIPVLPGSIYTSLHSHQDEIKAQLQQGIRVLDITADHDKHLMATIHVLKDIVDGFFQSPGSGSEFVVLVLRIPTQERGIHKDFVSPAVHYTSNQLGLEELIFGEPDSLNRDTPVSALRGKVVLVTNIPALSGVPHLSLEKAFSPPGPDGIWGYMEYVDDTTVVPRCFLKGGVHWEPQDIKEALIQNGIVISNSQLMPDAKEHSMLRDQRTGKGFPQQTITPL